MDDARDGVGFHALRAAAILFFVASLVVVGWNIPLPLIAYSPGPTSDAVDAVVVEGADTFPPGGEMIMLTVQSQDLNLFEAVLAGIDPTLDVLARQVVRRPDETDEDYRRRNLEMMDQSTQVAIGVALSHLDLTDEEQEVFITGYASDTPAGEVLEIGDRIVSLGGTDIATPEDLSGALEGSGPGDSVTVVVERDGERLDFDIELDAFEEDPERPFIGIVVRQLPYWIDIDSGIVGGPSAGMMYSLAIIDVLTAGDLTQGRVVAGTGTVDPDGNVGSIGGVRQKVVAAEAAGAEYMLVPAGNHEDALTAPRESMELVSVETVDEALAFLESLDPAA
jgi:Lon-like protease